MHSVHAYKMICVVLYIHLTFILYMGGLYNCNVPVFIDKVNDFARHAASQCMAADYQDHLTSLV